ncbi:2-hydroxyacid dehydrogenase [Tabrizicola sp. DMG-N-6]|uniref:2-hydroxyacid dehydrogenase n=2 Tax=Szabonella alba TaxID=2804194 RepID=A0A8K0XZD8_9RHOB|nr:2-hydroxyacid dehydrogenase [Szabonella alba]
MTKTVVLSIGSYAEWDIPPMRADYDLTELSSPAGLDGLDADRRAAVRAVAYKGHSPFGAAQMDLLPGLELIANFGVGYDAIDVAAASARNIRVTNTPDVLNDDVADLAIGMLLALNRNLTANEAWLHRGDWSSKGDPQLARKLSGARAGIMGLGRIGREIADRMAAFKMEIHYHSRSRKETPEGWIWHERPEDLAANCDYLVVALVGGKATEGYVSRSVIEAMGPDSVICNISRGTTIDEPAMLDALEAGRIRGAALDVFRVEPDLDPRFLKLTNAHLQPHQGSATVETRKGMGALQRANIAAFVAGKPLLTAVN